MSGQGCGILMMCYVCKFVGISSNFSPRARSSSWTSGTTEGPTPPSAKMGHQWKSSVASVSWDYRSSVDPQHGVMLKKAHQRLYPLRCLRKCGISTQWLVTFYRGTIESILSGGVTVWCGNTTAQDRKAIQGVVRTAEKTIRCSLPSIDENFRTRCRQKASSIIQDHPGHQLFSPLRSSCRFGSI